MAISDIMIAPATLYTGPVGSSIPGVNSLAYGGNWPAGWIKVGYTTAPVTISHTRDLVQVDIEQAAVPVRSQAGKETLLLETTLAELTGVNFNYLVDGTLTTTTASGTDRASEKVEVGGKMDVSERAWGFEGLFKRDGNVALPVRFIIYRATAILNGKLEFSKKAAAGLPLQVSAMIDDSKPTGEQLFYFVRVTAKQTDEV